ncbi:hypothetical protein CSAL01_11072 [Colletotrichum salicis]|uniref:Mid2 domain-containing protein n=1 Tax=Colletotrichum salicis TaxID=1209931 RepID=A0A135URR6_9PEZI|nr:hypothetical protein CSAL01_11072 [Colletotrichum salicis]
MASHPFLSLLITLLLSVAQVRAACYYPDGSIAPNDTPCQDLTAESTCCGQGYACLSNAMCEATGKELSKDGATELVRGSCTDPSWRSSSCPLFCINPETDNVGGGIGVSKCEGTAEELYYCINSVMDTVNCTAKKNVLFFQRKSFVLFYFSARYPFILRNSLSKVLTNLIIVESPTAITTIGVAATPTPSSSSSSSTFESTLVATAVLIVPSVNPSSTPNPSSLALSSVTHSSTQSPTSSLETSPTTEPEATNDKTVIIGAAVGSSVGGLALGILAAWLFIFLCRRKRRIREEAAQTQVQYYTPGPPPARYVSPPVFDQVYEAPNEWKPPLVSDHFAPQELPGWSPEPRRS